MMPGTRRFSVIKAHLCRRSSVASDPISRSRWCGRWAQPRDERQDYLEHERLAEENIDHGNHADLVMAAHARDDERQEIERKDRAKQDQPRKVERDSEAFAVWCAARGVGCVRVLGISDFRRE
jgi:hypothetical protein